MRRQDIDRLSAPYPGGSTPPSVAPLRAALGIDVPKWSEFTHDIFSDLQDEAFGVHWWTEGSLDPQRCVLISDYLLQVTQGVKDNITEAQLHYLEWLGAAERESRKLDMESKRLGQLSYAASTSPAEDLPALALGLHEAGVARAIGSTFDCMASVLVVVTAAPVSVIDATYTKVVKILRDRAASPKAQPSKLLELQALTALDDAVCRAGPTGWLEWALDLRNMYVHRGRRMQMNEVTNSSLLVDAAGRPVPKIEVIRRLPKSPDRSDVESFRDFRSVVPVLPEDAAVTMQELIRATRYVIDEVGDALHKIWANRRLDSAGPDQPAQQWPLQRPLHGGFSGFHGGRAFNPSSFRVNANFTRRLKSAALLDAERDKVWK